MEANTIYGILLLVFGLPVLLLPSFMKKYIDDAKEATYRPIDESIYVSGGLCIVLGLFLLIFK